MAVYSKSLEDYFRIPVLIKTITPLTQASQHKIAKSLYYKHYSLPIDQRYSRFEQNINTQILINRDHCVQKFYFTPQDFFNDWPQFQVIYKIRFVIGIIDEDSDEKQIQQILGKIKNENNYKMIGIIDMGNSNYENLLKKQNIIKYPNVQEQQFNHFIEPWLYNCLSFVESQICNLVAQTKKDEENNRTIVFNQKQDKFDPKIMKRKKKYRCIKLSADYHLMLQLYKEAFIFYGEAQEQLRKIDDYIWILGALQGKLACTVVCQSLSLSNHEEYIETLISETYIVAKKTKNHSFQCENALKIVKLYLNQPEKLDQLVKSFLVNYARNLHDDEKFLLYTVLGQLYDRGGLIRKKNMYYFFASQIHINKKSELSQVLLVEIQKSKEIKQDPFLYKNILQIILSETEKGVKTNEYYLQLLSKCGNNLSNSQIDTILSELNFNNQPIYQLENIDFIKIKDFSVEQSKIKPKQNRIGRRQSPVKAGPGFFMSWKKDDNFLFQENQQVVFKGILSNSILFPFRLKISFQVSSLSDSNKKIANQQLFFYLEPNSSQKFSSKIRLKGVTQEIWIIDHINLYVWNFRSKIKLACPIKLQIYQKQPQLQLIVPKELRCQDSRCFNFPLSLKKNVHSVQFCLIKLNVSIYYSIDVGFQQNQIILTEEDSFQKIDFSINNNIRIVQNGQKQKGNFETKQGVTTLYLKKLKVNRKFVSRIECTLEYIRNMNTKYQTSKHYISKCSFYQQFSYVVQQITTPMIKQVYKNCMPQLKVIEKYYIIRIKVTKLTSDQSSNSYIIHHGGKQYRFQYQNYLTFQFTRQKKLKQEEDELKQLKEYIQWSNIFHKQEKGEVQISIPFHELMIKSEKQINLEIINLDNSKNQRKKIQVKYKITSCKPVSLSHSIILYPIEQQIDRMYVLKGKSKVESDIITSLSNTLTITFSQKCKNSYQIGITFKDGQIYWHDLFLTVP